MWENCPQCLGPVSQAQEEICKVGHLPLCASSCSSSNIRELGQENEKKKETQHMALSLTNIEATLRHRHGTAGKARHTMHTALLLNYTVLLSC